MKGNKREIILYVRVDSLWDFRDSLSFGGYQSMQIIHSFSLHWKWICIQKVLCRNQFTKKNTAQIHLIELPAQCYCSGYSWLFWVSLTLIQKIFLSSMRTHLGTSSLEDFFPFTQITEAQIQETATVLSKCSPLNPFT